MASGNDPKNATEQLWSSPLSPTRQESGPSLKLKGRYLIERELGRGGIGVVYFARDERLHSMPVVIKFLLDNSGQSAWLAKKFLQEAEALSRINHPGVVRVIDKDLSDDGRPFFVMEFISGKSLRETMTATGMDLEHAATLIRQTGQALGAAHREGVFHRDLKPENIMLQTLGDGEEQIKLIDFGIAKVKDSQAGGTTEVAVVAGSLNYMAPEQLSGQTVSASTDIYAFGIIAYEMITGRRPFNADAANYLVAMQQLSTLQQTESVISPRQLRPSLPDAAQQILLRSLSYDPAKRPQDARAFGEELARALIDASPGAGTGAISMKSTVIAEARKTQAEPGVTARTGKLWIALIALILAVAAIPAVMFWPSSPPVSSTAPTTPPAAASERAIAYSVTVQKDPKLYPDKKPFQLPGEVVFSAGDRVRFTFTSQQSGFLYIINEGPAGDLNSLFPSETANNSSAEIKVAQQIQIPERGDGFIFDAEEGTEKLWLVWSANAVAELEAVKRWANPKDRGEIKDAMQITALRQFLAKHSASAPETIKDEDKKLTALKSQGEVLVKLIKLEHH
jgi:serine/threonine-protein kinase